MVNVSESPARAHLQLQARNQLTAMYPRRDQGGGYGREVDNGDPAAQVPAGVDGYALTGRKAA